ncbi:CRISPR-associated protein Csx3 [Ktedonobacter racemifer]|nr:CRISPR-associated protein Csx3 [Ktedonobacter racemifer]
MGKTVLLYSLAEALRQRGIAHHTIRACPDGEGNWSQEATPEVVQRIRSKGAWSDEFTERICQDLPRRLLPMLIDAGGRPLEQQLQIFQECTHAILLFQEQDQTSKAFWLNVVDRCGLIPLAQIDSARNGTSSISQSEPIILGTLAGLRRHETVNGDLFTLLVDRIASLFSSYSLAELERIYLEQAPTEFVLEVKQLLQTIAPAATRWDPSMLRGLLEYVPANCPLSVYGHGPHWLYGALAAHTGTQAFYQFNPRDPNQQSETSMGWMVSPPIHIGVPNNEEMCIDTREGEEYVQLTIKIEKHHLEYDTTNLLAFPLVTCHKGLVLNGKMPSWLLTALVRFYAPRVSWIAYHYPQIQGAIIIASQCPLHPVGGVLPFLLSPGV